MHFLNEEYKPIQDIVAADEKLFWIYDVDKKDFFLRKYHTWYNLRSETYLLEVRGGVFRIPANFFIVIGDYDGGLDTIPPHEIVGRDFDVMTFSTNLTEESWSLDRVRVVGYEEESEFQIPFTKHPLPIVIDSNKAILVSQHDIFNKIKRLDFADII